MRKLRLSFRLHHHLLPLFVSQEDTFSAYFARTHNKETEKESTIACILASPRQQSHIHLQTKKHCIDSRDARERKQERKQQEPRSQQQGNNILSIQCRVSSLRQRIDFDSLFEVKRQGSWVCSSLDVKVKERKLGASPSMSVRVWDTKWGEEYYWTVFERLQYFFLHLRGLQGIFFSRMSLLSHQDEDGNDFEKYCCRAKIRLFSQTKSWEIRFFS